MYHIQETVKIGQLLHYDPIRNVLKRPQGRDVPRVSRLGVRGDIRSYTRRESLEYRSVLVHGQQLMGQLANEGLGKNKIGRFAIRIWGRDVDLLKQAKCIKIVLTLCQWTAWWMSSHKWDGTYELPRDCQPSRPSQWACLLHKVDTDSGMRAVCGLDRSYLSFLGCFGYCCYAQPTKSKCQCFTPNYISFPGGTN